MRLILRISYETEDRNHVASSTDRLCDIVACQIRRILSVAVRLARHVDDMRSILTGISFQYRSINRSLEL